MGNIQTPRAKSHDARFLAVLDTFGYHGENLAEYRQERMQHWMCILAPENEEARTVFVAREGGMYLGYIAIDPKPETSSSYDLYLGPCARDEMSVTKALLERAGVVLHSQMPDPQTAGLAVA